MDTEAADISCLQLGLLFIPWVSKRTFYALDKAFLAGHDVIHLNLSTLEGRSRVISVSFEFQVSWQSKFQVILGLYSETIQSQNRSKT